MSYNWKKLNTFSSAVDINGLPPGVYEIEIIAINSRGVRSKPATLKHYISPQANIPSVITGARITPLDETTGLLSWNPTQDVNILVGGQVIVNHSPDLEASDWNYSTEIIPRVSGTQNNAIVPLIEGTYMLKYSTNSGIRSKNSASTALKPPKPRKRLEVAFIQEHTTLFAGELLGLRYDATRGGLLLAYGFDALALDGNFDGLSTIGTIGGVNHTGYYSFDSIITLDGVYDLNLTRRISVEPFNTSDIIDSNIAYLDTWGDFDGIDVTDANATLYVRSTESGATPALIDANTAPIDEWPDFEYGSTWSDWRICTNNLVRGRTFEFKAVLTSDQLNQNLVVTDLGVLAELQQRIAHSAVITSGTSTYTVTFENAFYQSPAVNITPINLATGDYFNLTSISETGFQLTFYDSGDNPVSRDFTYTAVGYGRRI